MPSCQDLQAGLHLWCWHSTKSSFFMMMRPKHNTGSLILGLSPPVTAYVDCFSHLLLFLGSLYCKQYGLRCGAVWCGFILFPSMKKSGLTLLTCIHVCSRHKKQTAFTGILCWDKDLVCLLL